MALFKELGFVNVFWLRRFLSNQVLQSTNSLGISFTDRSCLIMDEVDGMSAGDRGGVGALNALIKKSKVGPSSRGRIFVLKRVGPDSNNLYCER
jgi:hypothetical protein